MMRAIPFFFAPCVVLLACVWTWGSNINFVGSGPNFERDLMEGWRLKAYDKRPNVDCLRYTYPSSPQQLNYGIPSNGYWQIGLVTTLYGIDIAGCGDNGNCQDGVILSVG